MPQKISIVNATVISPKMVEEAMKLIGSFTGTLLPKGIYRSIARLYNDDDPQGIIVSFHAQLYFRLNDDIF